MERILPVNIKKVHFVGIGGIGMSGLAFLFKDKGIEVTGSDIKETETVRKLRQKGIKVNIPHSGKVVRGTDIVCYSSAIKEDNPELKEAESLNVPLIKRGVLLGRILKGKKVISVAGSHGKTTTTSFLSFALQKLGRNISSLVGGIPKYAETSSWWGKDMFVVETDESDASFLEVDSLYSVVTNIDKEHLGFYKSMDNLRNAFALFIENTGQLVVGCGDDKNVREIFKGSRGEFLTYGLQPDNDLQARKVKFDSKGSKFDIFFKDEFVINVEIPLLGNHNVLNSLAVFALCYCLGYSFEKISSVVKDFPGTSRRLEFKGQVGTVEFFDDYAHHPKEIESVLASLSAVKKDRLVSIFQPHRYSRVKNLLKEFSLCFDKTDLLIVTDIYSAGEDKIEGIDAQVLVDRIKKNTGAQVQYVPKEELFQRVPLLFEEGDFVLSLGAGDINIIQEELLRKYRTLV